MKKFIRHNVNTQAESEAIIDEARRPVSPSSAMTSRSKVKFAGSRGPSDRCWLQSLRNTKIGGKVAHLTGNNAHQIRGQKAKPSRSPGRLMLKPKVCRLYELQKFKFDRRLVGACEVGLLHAGGAYHVGHKACAMPSTISNNTQGRNFGLKVGSQFRRSEELV